MVVDLVNCCVVCPREYMNLAKCCIVCPTSLPGSGWEFAEVLCVVYPSSSLRSGWKFGEVLCCVSHDFITEWLGFGKLLCRVSHEFTKWLGIRQTVVSCVTRVYV